ncbi:MAG: zinc-ribbon domain-containing protein [Candidatus Hodarchaeota archaeon]
MSYCPKCGNSVPEDSNFCDSCGYNLTKSSIHSTDISRKSEFVQPSTFYPPYRRRTRPIIPIAIAGFFVFIIVTIGFGVLFFSFLTPWDYEYLGEHQFTIPSESTSTIQLELSNDIGNVFINTDPGLPYSLSANIVIYGLEGHELANANKIESSQQGLITTVSFSSRWDDDPETRDPYRYEVEILVRSNAIIGIDASTSTGDLYIAIVNSTITEFQVATGTGYIDIILKDIYEFNDTSPNLAYSTGDTFLMLDNINYTTQMTNWTIESNTGDVDLTIIQEISEYFTDSVRGFFIEADTGNIEVTVDLLSNEYGISATAIASTGTIDLPSGNSSYQTENYGASSWKYVFILRTSTGHISLT